MLQPSRAETEGQRLCPELGPPCSPAEELAHAGSSGQEDTSWSELDALVCGLIPKGHVYA